jgi:predicted esterase
LKNWPRKFVLACAAISLAAGRAQSGNATPALALAGAADAASWEEWAKPAGWKILAAPAEAAANADARLLALAQVVRDAVARHEVDPAHVYLAGRGDDAAMVFYGISRLPDLWAAGVAIGGSPQPAIETGRLFTTNFGLAPVLWIGGNNGDQAFAERLRAAGINLEWRPPAGLATAAVFEWLAGHERPQFPAEIDCETNSPEFARCYWLTPMTFDAAERNDVLPSTRLAAGSGAYLDLGGFGYKTDDPGPGLLVTFLPQKYNGPLKLGDRLMELDGKPIANPAQYAAMMGRMNEARHAAVMLERGKDRMRIETTVRVPRRDSLVTARVQGRYDSDQKQVLIISRMVTKMNVNLPSRWLPATLFWNGLSLENVAQPGCIQLTIDHELLHAAPCP